MPSINLLDAKTYNKIAAGEVVERPSSCVKELLENAIDAGAKKIRVEIEDGGIGKIQITDNGVGMDKEDLKNCVLPHATSKIETIDDLLTVSTLGFRGEALASVAAVSKLKITTKKEDMPCAYTLEVEDGVAKIPYEDVLAGGTNVLVSDLFYNVPARKKFLKSTRAEEGEVTSVVSRFILGYPDVAFTYVVDGKTVLQSFGDGFENAVVSVYGVKAVQDSFLVNTVKNGMKIYGYLGKHYYTKGNRNYQTVFLNGRYIVNSTVSSAIQNAYSTYLMKRQYPVYTLKIDVLPEIVDVNVHPQKADVRFSDNQIIYGSLYSVVSKVLDGTSDALNIVTESDPKEQIKAEIPSEKQENKTIDGFSDLTLKEPKSYEMPSKLSEALNKREETLTERGEELVDRIFAENKAYLNSLENKNENTLYTEEKPIQESVLEKGKDLRFIGQALNTFLILEDGSDLYFIDQHAAHERILYDTFIERFQNKTNTVQPMLVPFVTTLSGLESTFLLKKLPYLQDLGFDIEEFGRNTFKISAVPSLLNDINVEAFLQDVIGDFEKLTDDALPAKITERIAQKACKAAIKSGDKLSESEINVLLYKLKDNLGLRCPHGRPVAVRITRTEIDKWFKRIV